LVKTPEQRLIDNANINKSISPILDMDLHTKLTTYKMMKPLTAEQATLAEKVLAHVGRKGYQPVKPRVIAKKLGVDPTNKTDYKRVMKRLIRQGQIVYGNKHMIQAAPFSCENQPKPPIDGDKDPIQSASISCEKEPQSPTQTDKDPIQPIEKPSRPKTGSKLVGRFSWNDGGFGFVRLQREPGEPELEDFFIPGERTADAVDGDLVRVEPVRGESKGYPSKRPNSGSRGQIVEVLERKTFRFVGTYYGSSKGGHVEIDRGRFAHPVEVGDPSAQEIIPGDKVVVEMVRFPTPFTAGSAVVIERLGREGDSQLDTRLIMREFDLPEQFEAEVINDAHRIAQEFDESQIGERLDLTDLTVVTIDPTDARDFDDAISLRRTEVGHWLLGVHIADVSALVPEGSELDQEAFRRATSVYLPDRVVPMLPETISNSLASLQPGRNRYAKTVFIEMTDAGQTVAVDLHSSVICSDQRLDYEEVDKIFADPQQTESNYEPPVFELLMNMRELAQLLRTRQIERGVLDLVLPDVKIDLDHDGRVTGAHRVEETESHKLIEQFMLAANTAVAEKLSEAKIPFLRRIHPAPSERKMHALTRFVSELGFEVESLQNRFELQQLLNSTADTPEREAVHYATLRAMQRAEYSPTEVGHYALGFEKYCHFTSPIRRYPDLLVHRLIDRLIQGEKTPPQNGQLTQIGNHCSDQERLAEKAERELIRLKLLDWMRTQIGETFDATIIKVNRDGLLVQGIEIPAEGLVPLDLLPKDNYRYSRKAHCLEGYSSGNTFRLGDKIHVAVGRVDLDERKATFKVVGGRTKSKTKLKHKSKKSGKKPGKSSVKKGKKRSR
jgi:ribonuclease R